MNWRPFGWDIADYFVERCENPLQITRAFEAGADAMLEYLASLVGDNGYITFEKEDGKVIGIYIDD